MTTATATAARPTRITSIDALRGFVMFTMIFVNDLAGGGKIVPNWMVHFSDRHKGGSGMTFVDVVFPAFLFIVGMSVLFALGSRLNSGEPVWKTLLHVLGRTLSLLFLGVLMVNEAPSSEKMGWSDTLWSVLMYVSAIFAFCSLSPGKSEAAAKRTRIFSSVSLILRGIGWVMLIWLAFAWRGENNQHIITLSPFSIRTEWWGILGIIGWAYLTGSLVFLLFRNNRTALLGCVVLLLCIFPADKKGFFDNFWLNNLIGIGELGSHASITVAGILLASILVAPEMVTVRARAQFALLFIGGFAVSAILLKGLYGISKNNATPSWCLWAGAITAALWLVFYFIADVRRVAFIARPLAVGGQNVLLAYLFSEMLPNPFHLIRLAEPGLAAVVAQSAGWAFVLLCITAGLNRLGFWLKL